MNITLNKQAISKLEVLFKHSAKSTMEDLLQDLIDSRTMPFDVGNMQNNQTFVAVENDAVRLVTGSPQAKRLYYHPEYNFQQGKNQNAGAKWLEPYLTGNKKDFVKDTFIENFKN